MNGKSLLIGLSCIDPKYIEESEKDTPARHVIAWKPLLIAAVIAALLLAGCGYVVLSEAQWLQSFFSRQKGQPLSQGQSAYIEQNTQVIGQSVTVNGYTVTVESAIAEERVACIRLRLEGPGLADIHSGDFRPRPLADGRGYESLFFEKGHASAEESPYGLGRWIFSPDGNAISILIQLDQSANPDAPSFEAGVPYVLHLTDLYVNGFGQTERILTEGTWDFEIVFDHLNTDSAELISLPITITHENISLRVTSVKLRTMGIDVRFAPGAYDYLGRDCFEDSWVVLKDGTRVSVFPQFYNPRGSAGLSLDCPIDLKEVDYVEFRDGTRLSM
ncbi:MAG: DUF4179 domain-containing protein [Clostridiales bacterium]|nr:DUF4179 domain-containing protein [Clostridiales bacterium]